MKNTMIHTIAQSPGPSVEGAFWRDMGWRVVYVKGLKRFASLKRVSSRRDVWRLLEQVRHYDVLPVGFVSLTDAEIEWGESLVDWALAKWNQQGRRNQHVVRVVFLKGQPIVILRRASLIGAYGEPKWTSVKKVAEKLRLSWMTVYHRLRYSSCRRKSVRRWIGGYHLLFNAEDVESEMQIWRTEGRGGNACNSGSTMKEYDGNDEIARSQWRRKLIE